MAVDINITGEFKSNGVAAQPTLVSGTNIKTINGNSVLGSGNLVVSGGVTSVTGTAPVVSSGGTTPAISMAAATTSVNGYLTSTNFNTFNNKQAPLVSGTNIKTVNSTTLLGSGDLPVQPTLVSGTNIKTVNGTTLLGSGNLVVGGRSGVEVYQSGLTQNQYQAAAGSGITILFGSPYPIATSTDGNIVKINIVFQGTSTIANSRLRIYASASPSSTSGATSIGFFDLTSANVAAFNDSVGYEKTFRVFKEAGTNIYSIGGVDAQTLTSQNDFTPRSFNYSYIGGTASITLPYIVVTLTQAAILHTVTINYSR